MRPLRYSINITLDGCCDHQAGRPDQEQHQHAARGLENSDGLLCGRIIYELMESAWRPAAESGVKPPWMQDWMLPFAHTIHGVKKFVVSNTLTSVDWNAELIRGQDLEQKIRALKNQPGKGLSLGGVTLALTLAKLGLIDEYEFIIVPRVAGHGPSVLAGLPKYLDLKLVERKEFRSGSVAMTYVPE